MKYKITFIGSGNVATNLAYACDKAGHAINQVISRNEQSAKELASKFGAYYGTIGSEIYTDADVIIMCVSDSAYAEAMSLVPEGSKAVLCHTSGPVSIDVLSSYTGESGVFYPLQSLRKEEVKDLMQGPIMVEWNGSRSKDILIDLADSISNIVRETSSEDRGKYHLAAVFANNFTNLMYVLSEQYLVEQGLDFKNLLPIIQETALRLKQGAPDQWQTGPAKRKDMEVITKHMAMLDNPELRAIYKQLSDFILNQA